MDAFFHQAPLLGGLQRRHVHFMAGQVEPHHLAAQMVLLEAAPQIVGLAAVGAPAILRVEFDQVQAGAGGFRIADGLRQLAHRLVVQAGRLAHAAQGGGQHRRHFALPVAIAIAIARTIILVMPGFGLRRRLRCRLLYRIQHRIRRRIAAPAPVARRRRAARSPQRWTRTQAPSPAAPTAGATPAFVLPFLFLLRFALPLPLPLLFPFILYGCAKRQHFK